MELQNFKYSMDFYKNEFFHRIRHYKNRVAYKPQDPAQKQAIKSLEKDGIAVVPNFVTNDFCLRAIEEIDQILDKEDCKLWKDKMEADTRIFGAEKLSNAINDFHQNAYLLQLLQAYMQEKISFHTVMAAKIVSKPGNDGSGGGWHRDSATHKQVKAILYLNDVKEQNGPFQYMAKSHKPSDVNRLALTNNWTWNKTRFEQEEIDKALLKNSHSTQIFTANRGTLILADTRGLHRGMPLIEGERYALTIYSWFSEKAPPHILKLVQ